VKKQLAREGAKFAKVHSYVADCFWALSEGEQTALLERSAFLRAFA
jgi:hypothetical protein